MIDHRDPPRTDEDMWRARSRRRLQRFLIKLNAIKEDSKTIFFAGLSTFPPRKK